MKVKISVNFFFEFTFSFLGLSNLIYLITLKLKTLRPDSAYFCSI